ncbi:MAG: ATP-grasp domain-containing protein [Bacteroidota bacterium]
MKTLILPPKYSEESNRMRKAALTAGWKVERLTSWRVPDYLRDHDVTIYAEPLFAARIEDALNLRFPTPPEDWLLRLPPEMVQRDIRAMSLAQARQLPERGFIKPADFKTFKAGVYPSGAALPDEEKVSGTEPVLVAEVVHWESEFRFFLRAGVARTGSVYFRNGITAEEAGEWNCTAEEYRAAKSIAESAYAATAEHLPDCVVIDTGYIRGKGWAVIEANPIWGSGLYGSDPARVLETLDFVPERRK